jgi:hypothetical protein
MEAWRDRLMAFREQLFEDDDGDDVMMNIVLDPFEGSEGSEGSDSSLEAVPCESMPGRTRNIDRERHMGHERMFADYFVDFPIYGAKHFRRRFRMQFSLFLMIMDWVCECDDYFVQKRDACGLWGLSSIQKCTATLRMLAYGVTADATDEYCRIGESTTMESMKRFCKAIKVEFGDQHLRQSLEEKLK